MQIVKSKATSQVVPLIAVLPVLDQVVGNQRQQDMFLPSKFPQNQKML